MKQNNLFAAAILAEQTVANRHDRNQFNMRPHIVGLKLIAHDGDEALLTVEPGHTLTLPRYKLFNKTLRAVQKHLKKERKRIDARRKGL